jgi:hypothetical protein
LKLSAKQKFDEIMLATQTQITVLGGTPLNHFANKQTEHIEIEIIGKMENVELAHFKCLIQLDQMFGLMFDTIDIDTRLQTIIAGRKRQNFLKIMQETSTNIYTPSPFFIPSSISSKNSNSSNNSSMTNSSFIEIKSGLLYLTGTSTGLKKVKELLNNLVISKKPQVLNRTVTCLPRKIDYIIQYKKYEILKIMKDNAVFISLPSLGTNKNIITIFGDNQIYLDRSIKCLMLLTCEIYVSCLQLNYSPLQQSKSTFSPSLNDLTGSLFHLTSSSFAEIVIKNQFIEIYGTQESVKHAYINACSLPFIKHTIKDTKFQLELSKEHQEFINGKKNGKINKIIRSSNCKINFQDYNNYNMLIDLYNPIPEKALEGLKMLEDELPAEISFHVPEIYHKRIIGVGGKNIQRIMKKYGVYVKFSNAEEYNLLGGYFENEDNVIARTPAKNAFNLNELKETVLESIYENDKRLITRIVNIPRQHHLAVMGYKGCNMDEIKVALELTITFPEPETGLDQVILIGTNTNTENGEKFLCDYIPMIYIFEIPGTVKAHTILYSNEFFTNKDTLYYNSGAIPPEFNVTHFEKKRARQEADKYIIEYGNTGKQPKLLGSSKMKLRSFVRKSDENYHPVLSTISETMNDGVYDKYYTYPEIKNYICKLTYEILDRTPLYIEKMSRLKSQAKSKSPTRERISHSRKRKRSDGRKRKSKKRSRHKKK